MKKEIIFGLAGVAVGVSATLLVQHIYRSVKPKETRGPLLTKDLPKEEPIPTSVPVAEEAEETEDEDVAWIEVKPEEMETFKKIIAENGYDMYSDDDAESEFPEDDDPDNAAYKAQERYSKQLEAYRKENAGKIELINEDQWIYDTDFLEDDYGREELFWFVPDNVLTDEDGNVLEPIDRYVGDVFDKTKFWTNDWKVIYIRNHPMETDYKITKPMDEDADDEGNPVYTPITKDDFFYTL